MGFFLNNNINEKTLETGVRGFMWAVKDLNLRRA